MPLFKRTDSPRLDRLSKTEERKKAAHDREVIEAASASASTTFEAAATTLDAENERLLKRRAAEDAREFLWPYLLGGVYFRRGNYKAALSASREASRRNPADPRGAYAVATAYYTAATQAILRHGGYRRGKVSLGMSLIELWENALCEFRMALELAERGGDRRAVQSCIDAIELGLSHAQSGRLG